MRKLPTLLCVLPFIVAVSASACSSDDSPAPTAADAATGGDGGGAGEGGGNGEGGGPGDGGGTGEGGGGDGGGGAKAFGEACASDGECQSNKCFTGSSQAFCSLACTKATQATDCPKPPTGGECNNQGFCRKP